jgi:hypothetical protein
MEREVRPRPQGAKSEWLIMVYLAGGEDKGCEARESLLRMKKVGSRDNVKIVAQFDSGTEGTSTKRYELTPYSNAMELRTFLNKACNEVPFPTRTTALSLGNYYYSRLVNAMPDTIKGEFSGRANEMITLLTNYPDQFKSLVLDSILDKDICGEEGILGETNAADPAILVDFVKWALETYNPDKTKKTMLIIWGHGNGLTVAWDYPALPGKSLGTAMTLNKLPRLIKEKLSEYIGNGDGHLIDILGFNSCSLGTIEVYTQLENFVKYGIASEGYTLDSSWPYDKILLTLINEPGTNVEAFCQKIVSEYINYYRVSVISAERNKAGREGLASRLDYNLAPGSVLGTLKPKAQMGSQVNSRTIGVDLSACNLSFIKSVVDAMKLLVSTLIDQINNAQVFSAILAAHSVSQSYYNMDFTDLQDFCRALATFCPEESIINSCTRVMGAINLMCPEKLSSNVGRDVERSHGVSIFFPWGDWDERDAFLKYQDLTFVYATHWHKFLDRYRAMVGTFAGQLKTLELLAAKPSASTAR